LEGYILLYRELLKKPIWVKSTPEQKTILVTLLLMASYTDNEWEWGGKKFIVKPGQFITSINSIISKCGKGITFQNVRSALERFKKLEFLTYESTKTGRLVTILNWHVYQTCMSEGNKETNKEATKTQQRGNKEVTTINKVNKVNKVNKKIYTEKFETAYKIYPRSQAKADTFKNWNKLLEEYTEDELLLFVQNYKDYYDSMLDEQKEFAFSSNNFFGKRGYWEDFKHPQKYKVFTKKTASEIKEDKFKEAMRKANEQLDEEGILNVEE